MISVYYEGLVGSLSLDWCDTNLSGTGTVSGTSSSPASGRWYGYGSRSDYNSTYRFVDINLSQGSGHQVTLFNPKVEAGDKLTDFVATERTNLEANSKDFNNVTATSMVRIGGAEKTANTNFDDLVIENVGGHSGITIYSKNDSDGGIYFGDDNANNLGQIKYLHGSNAMTFTTNNAAASLTLNNDLTATFQGNIHTDVVNNKANSHNCLLYTSPSTRDRG